MNRHWMCLPFFALFALTLSCSGGPEKKDQPLTDSGPIPRYLELIPASTPFAFGALDPVPEPVALEQYSFADRRLSQFLAPFDPSAELSYMQPEEKFVIEVARELNGKLDEEGLAELGLSTSPRFVVYGVGPFPVFRMEIADAAMFNAMIDRAQKKAGLTMQSKTLEGVEYRSFVVNEVEMSLAVIGNEVVFTGALLDASPIVVPYALGVKKPAASLAGDNVLEKLAEQYGMQRHGVGFVNVVESVAMLAGSGDALNAAAFAVVDDSPDPTPAVCQKESNEYAAAMPLVAFGLEGFSGERVSMKIAAQFTNDIPARLKATKRTIPGWSMRPMTGEKGGPVKVGLGFRVGDVLNIARDELRATRDRAFECPELQGLPQSASEMLAMSQFVPPVVGDLEGVRVEFEGVRNSADGSGMPGTPNVDLWAVVNTPDPQTLFRTLMSFAPAELQKLQLEPTGEPVAVEMPAGTGTPVEALKLFMTKRTLGLTTSDPLIATAQSVANAESTEASPMIAVAFDLSRMMATFMQTMQPTDGEEESQQPIVVTVDPTDDAIISTIDVPLSVFEDSTQ